MRFSFTVGGGVFLLAALCAVPASAAISPIGPFVGTYSETWESFPRFLPSQMYLPNPSDIMGGFASISNAWMDVYQPTAGDHFSLQSNGFAIPSDGVKAMGLDFTPATATITFDAPINSFGAYWGASSLNGDNITVNFSDGSSDTFNYEPIPNSGILEWHGWSSTVAFTSVTYSGNFVVTDGIQATPVPEPATLALCGVGLSLGLLRRQRRTNPQ